MPAHLGTRNILTKSHQKTLSAFASANVLLGFDYDGTLAPVTAIPGRANMRVRTRRLLSAVAQRYPCVVISGRAAEDLAKRVGGLPLAHVVGNHGVEPWETGERSAEIVRRWIPRLRAHLDRYVGVVVEDKTYSVCVHYRHARSPRIARRAIVNAAHELPVVRVIGGDHAINLIVQGGPDKGVALQRARRAFACEVAVYVGNDETDEDAFASASPDSLLSIRVGRAKKSRARYHLRSQSEIDRLLEILLALRSR